MVELLVPKKSGFIAPEPRVIVLDSNGFPFYDFVFKKPPYKFNLPRGKFFVNQRVKMLPKPIKFPVKPLPKREFKNRRFPKRWKVKYGNNPNKCTVNYATGTLFFDNAYKNCPRVIKDFIFCHEMGHKFYRTERYADLWATNQMLKKGYNPSQVLKAHFFALSDRSWKRKRFIINKFKK